MPLSNRVQAQPGRYLEALRADVAAGLIARPKTLPPKYFYDARGSELFDEITRLPEYYLTRAETAICCARCATAGRCASSCRLTWTPPCSPRPARPWPLSTRGWRSGRSSATSSETSTRSRLAGAARSRSSDRRSATSSRERARRSWRTSLLGIDLVKDTDRLLSAYDDAAGVTAEFNRNMLIVVNRELDADFAVDEFAHVALWDPEHEWIEMRLRPARAQQVTIRDLDLVVPFAAGEDLRTEISAKFRRAKIEAELAAAGMRVLEFWTDPDADFALLLAEPR